MEKQTKEAIIAMQDDEDVELFVEKLNSMKNNSTELMNKYYKKFKEEEEKVNKINEVLCLLNGHDFSSWISFNDDDVYVRECYNCGKEEITSDDLDEYVTIEKETGIVHKRVKKD